MSHDHSHAHDGAGNLKVAFLLNLGFTIIEIAGGFWTNSIAILTDAVHDSGDCISLGFAWYLQKISSRERTSTYTYGYRRFSVLGALITGLVLLAGLTFILWNAVKRLISPEEVLAPGMIALAVIGVVMNGAAVLRVRKGESLSEKVVSWHLLEDTLGWIAVLIGALIMTFRTGPSLIRFSRCSSPCSCFTTSGATCGRLWLFFFSAVPSVSMRRSLKTNCARCRACGMSTIRMHGRWTANITC